MITKAINEKQEKLDDRKDMLRLKIKTENYSQTISINGNLSIDNLRATIGMELQREVSLEVENEKILGNKEISGDIPIKEVLYDQDVIIVKDECSIGNSVPENYYKKDYEIAKKSTQENEQVGLYALKPHMGIGRELGDNYPEEEDKESEEESYTDTDLEDENIITFEEEYMN